MSGLHTGLAQLKSHSVIQSFMYCIDTEALVFMFNGGSPYGFTIHPIFTRIYMLYGLKVPLLVYTNHINNEKHVHHGFLAPRASLCSTSLKASLLYLLLNSLNIKATSSGENDFIYIRYSDQ